MGRPPSRPGLGSTSRRELCWFLAQGYPQEEAAKRAGLPDVRRLHAFARTREFADELREAMHDHMGVNLAPKAVRILDEIMSDSKVQPRVRVDAAKALLDRAGYSASEERKKPLGPDDIEAMSVEELQQFIQAGERTMEDIKERRANGAKLIDNDTRQGVLG
ncbi:MAG TPA: hypothetical protein VM144_11240 [Aestuariivirga sp.]|nr:hypothetical protein [Aestuariivirga sp.]